MKKRILYIILLCQIILSCNKLEKEPNLNLDNNNVLGFSTIDKTQTKATECTDENMESFGVYAYYTGQDNFLEDNFNSEFMFNQEISRTIYEQADPNQWVYSPLAYWPETTNDKISLFAYSPYITETNGIELNNTKSTTTSPVLDFKTPTNILDQIDLMYGIKMNLTNQATSISIPFKHALTKISFSFSTTQENINVSKIEIIDIPKSSGQLSLKTGDWTINENNLASYIYEDINFSITSTEIIGLDEVFMLIPQSFNSNNESAKIIVTYNRNNGIDDITKEYILKEIWNGGETKNYNFSFGEQEVTVDPDVNFISTTPEYHDAHYIIQKISINSTEPWTMTITGDNTGDAIGNNGTWAYLSKEKTKVNDLDSEITAKQKNGLWSYDAAYNKNSISGSAGTKDLYLFLRENAKINSTNRTINLELISTNAQEDYSPKILKITQLPVEWVDNQDFGIERIEEKTDIFFGFYASGNFIYTYNETKINDAYPSDTDNNITNSINSFIQNVLKFRCNQFGKRHEVPYTSKVVDKENNTNTTSLSSGINNTIFQMKNTEVAIISDPQNLLKWYDLTLEGPENVPLDYFQNFAARYSIMKNADLNNNGVLEEDEIKWYLPSINELGNITTDDIAEGVDAFTTTKAYWSSTAINSNNLRSRTRQFWEDDNKKKAKDRQDLLRVRSVRVKP